MVDPVEDGVAYYSKVATDFHASYSADPNRLDRVSVWRQFLDRYSGGARTAYDIGCGSGVLACELARRGIETTGIDGAAGMLSIAERVAHEQGLANVKFRQARLPIPDTSDLPRAQLVVSSSAIEYLESLSDALTCLRDLLEDSGVAIFSVSNKMSISRALVRACHRVTGRPHYLDYLRHFVSLREIRSLTEQAGLRYLGHAYFGGADRLNQMLKRVFSEPLTNNMIIVAAQKDSARRRA
jgi:2-polyprenyl-3-methyl-5-hydroxy-6-metoxy-1,4-benzoquinol methylase